MVGVADVEREFPFPILVLIPPSCGGGLMDLDGPSIIMRLSLAWSLNFGQGKVDSNTTREYRELIQGG